MKIDTYIKCKDCGKFIKVAQGEDYDNLVQCKGCGKVNDLLDVELEVWDELAQE